jgi:hypothetical protein
MKETLGKGEVQPAINLITRNLSDARLIPAGFLDVMRTARAADSSILINNPDIAIWLVGLARRE